MKAPRLLPKELFVKKLVFANKTSVRDVASSLREFISRNYNGIVDFSPFGLDNRFILVEDYELAIMIRSVIKEFTLKHICTISFLIENDDFIISFKAHEDSPPSENAITHLRGQAQRYGLSSTSDGLSFGIVIPTHKFSSCPIYNKDRLKFYDALFSVFSEQ